MVNGEEGTSGKKEVAIPAFNSKPPPDNLVYGQGGYINPGLLTRPDVGENNKAPTQILVVRVRK